MAVDDVPAMLAIQRVSYPPHMLEPAGAYQRRLRLFPAGSVVAVDGASGEVVGYAQSHPWPASRLHEPAHLDDEALDGAVAEALAAPVAVLYVHEVCVREDRRGGGVGGALMRRVLSLATGGDAGADVAGDSAPPASPGRYSHALLVAVLGNGPRWARFGFEAVGELRGEYEAPDPAGGPPVPAVLMVKAFGDSACDSA